MVDVDAPLRTIYWAKLLRWKCGMGKDGSVTVKSQVNLIRRVAYGEIFVGIIILFSQTIAIASSHEFATRSLTGIWTSWFFFISAGITLFWSSRCTFNGLLSVLVLQIISATMGIPLFTASCVLFGVFPFQWNLLPDGTGAALVGSSLSILVTNLIMMFASLLEMGLNGYNTYNCYFLAYGGKPKENSEYDEDVGIGGNGRGPITRGSKEGSRNATPSRGNLNKNVAQTHSNGNGTSKGTNGSRPNSGGNSRGGSSKTNNRHKNNQRPDTSSNANYTAYQNNEDEDWGDGPNNTTTQQPQQDDEDWGDNDNTASQNQQNGDQWGNDNANNDENWDDQGNDNDWDANPEGTGQIGWVENNTRQAPKVKGQAPKGPKMVGEHTLSPKKGVKTKIVYADPSMPQPPPDLTLASQDIIIIKYCGVTGVLLAILIFSCQTAMLALATEPGIKIAIGIWGALYYAATGVITVYNGWKPTAQSSVAIFILQSLQLILSLPMVGIAYYIVAVFGSCIQYHPVAACPGDSAGLAITVLASVMAISGTVQGLISLILVLICSQAVCGIRCMVSGATVYPTL